MFGFGGDLLGVGNNRTLGVFTEVPGVVAGILGLPAEVLGVGDICLTVLGVANLGFLSTDWLGVGKISLLVWLVVAFCDAFRRYFLPFPALEFAVSPVLSIHSLVALVTAN